MIGGNTLAYLVEASKEIKKRFYKIDPKTAKMSSAAKFDSSAAQPEMLRSKNDEKTNFEKFRIEILKRSCFRTIFITVFKLEERGRKCPVRRSFGTFCFFGHATSKHFAPTPCHYEVFAIGEKCQYSAIF